MGTANNISIKSIYAVKRISFEESKYWLLEKHYAHRIPCVSRAFGLFNINKKTLDGVCTVGKPASPTLCDGVCGKEYSQYVYELNRLVIEEGLPKNTLSYFVSKVLSFFRAGLTIIVSYADTGMNHCGYIYQATNFIYTGLTKERTDIYTGEQKHSRHYEKNTIDYSKRQIRTGKHRYIYFAGQKKYIKLAKEKLKYKIFPYPKTENKRYTTETIEKENYLFIV